MKSSYTIKTDGGERNGAAAKHQILQPPPKQFYNIRRLSLSLLIDEHIAENSAETAFVGSKNTDNNTVFTRFDHPFGTDDHIITAGDRIWPDYDT